MNSKKGDMQFLKRNSLMGDELLNFDPSELEDDDWNVFDDEAHTDGIDPGSSSIPNSNRDKTQKPANAASSASNATASSTDNTTGNSNEASTSSPSETPFENISSDLDSTKKDQKKDTQLKKADGGASKAAWHSEAADLPHRKAMVQEM